MADPPVNPKKRLRRLVSVALILLVVPAAGAAPKGIRTPADLVAYLKGISGKHTISGQYVETGDLAPINALHAKTGKWLGLISGDYYHYDHKGDPVTTFNASAISYWKAGGLVLLNLHMPNPTTGKPVYDLTGLDTEGLLKPGTPTNAALMRALGKIAAGIRELRDAGVVVILRPYHESGGDWFWWCSGYKLSHRQVVDLWRFTHDYLEKTEGLHNIVWLFESGQPDVPVKLNYPGDDYVDIVGQDVYLNEPGGKPVIDAYDTLVGTGKLVSMSEFGPGSPQLGNLDFPETTLVAAFRDKMPRTVFYVQWWDGNGGRTGWGMSETKDISKALNDPWILNRDDIVYDRKSSP
ncbi:MAG TPA: glycosyl hydrolase [Opitutaceae bacterium]|nr:glycosyl hydrolase [Opitutaceae bacterium]